MALLCALRSATSASRCAAGLSQQQAAPFSSALAGPSFASSSAWQSQLLRRQQLNTAWAAAWTSAHSPLFLQPQRGVASKKGVEAKPNKTSWLYRIKEFFSPNLTDGQPRSRPGRRWSPDHRDMTSEQWMAQGIHKSIRIFLRYHCIVPDILPEVFSPKVNLLVSYGQTSWDVVYRGNFLPVLDTFKRPFVTIKSDTLNPSAYYTLLMVTPDEPARTHPEARQKLLWYISDIPGSAPEIDGGQEHIPYTHPLPLRNTGEHRYVFILAEQKEKMPDDFSAASLSSQEPGRFDTAELLAKHGFDIVGISFFQAEYTPELLAYYEKNNIEEPYLETAAQVKSRVQRAQRLETLASASKNTDPSL